MAVGRTRVSPTAARGADARRPRISPESQQGRPDDPRLAILRPRRATERARREPNARGEREKKINLFPDGCQTDPEPGMDSRRATVRNMRSKCRCSCVLQFTFRRAVSCVLHRPPSQVIHCIVLCLFRVCLERASTSSENTAHFFTSHHGEHTSRTRAGARILKAALSSSWLSDGAPHPNARAARRGPGRLTTPGSARGRGAQDRQVEGRQEKRGRRQAGHCHRRPHDPESLRSSFQLARESGDDR